MLLVVEHLLLEAKHLRSESKFLKHLRQTQLSVNQRNFSKHGLCGK